MSKKLIVVKRFVITSVSGEGGGVPSVAGMGKYVCREQLQIFQQKALGA